MATEVNISSYSGSVSAGDWSPAFMAAWAAIETTGGTINIDTNIELKSQCDMSADGIYQNLTVAGDGGAAITVNAGSSDYVFYFGNMNQVTFKDLMVKGKQADTTAPNTVDCRAFILASTTEQTKIENCVFAGIKTTEGIVWGYHTGVVRIERTKFGGSGVCVQADQVVGLEVDSVQCIDYQNYLSGYYDRQSFGTQWIKAINGATPVNSYAPYINIKNFVGDEGTNAIDITDYERVIIDQSATNMNGGASAFGIRLTNVSNANIRQFWAGYNNVNPNNSIELINCGYVEIDGIQIHNGPHPIEIDALTAMVNINGSPTATIDAASASNYSINGCGSSASGMTIFPRRC